MLRIRLRRVGKRKHAAYRVVVCDQRTQRDGAFIENLGSYEPHANPPIATLNEESAKDWLSKGASPSEAVEKIFRRSGIIEGGSMERAQVTAKPAAEAPAEVIEEAPAEAPEAAAPEASEEAPAETGESVDEEATTEAPVASAEEAPAKDAPETDSSTEEE
jgi:small subunit ribosomal protein S16